MSTPPNPTLEELDQMYVDATAACQRIWNAINDARATGINVDVDVLSGRVVVKCLKGQQLVWIDAASTVNFASVIRSATPAETEINPS